MGILLPILTGLLLLYADYKSRKKLNQNIHGQFSLKLNASYKWVGFACCLIGSFLLNAAISNWNEEIYLMASFAVLMFFGIGILLLIWYYNYELVFDEKRITATNWKQNKKTIHWMEVEKVEFNATLGYLKLYSKNIKMVVFEHSVGFVEFLRNLESKTKFKI